MLNAINMNLEHNIEIYAALVNIDLEHLLHIKVFLKDFIESIVKCPKVPTSMVS